MNSEELTSLAETHPVYGFYVFGNEIVCSKLKKFDKYFIDKDGCSCKGFRSHGKCKHVNMLNGAWTPSHGTPDWYENLFGGILPKVELPESFNTVFVVDKLPHNFKVVCITATFDKYSMGVTVFDPSFDKSEFERILCRNNS